MSKFPHNVYRKTILKLAHWGLRSRRCSIKKEFRFRNRLWVSVIRKIVFSTLIRLDIQECLRKINSKVTASIDTIRKVDIRRNFRWHVCVKRWACKRNFGVLPAGAGPVAWNKGPGGDPAAAGPPLPPPPPPRAGLDPGAVPEPPELALGKNPVPDGAPGPAGPLLAGPTTIGMNPVELPAVPDACGGLVLIFSSSKHKISLINQYLMKNNHTQMEITKLSSIFDQNLIEFLNYSQSKTQSHRHSIQLRSNCENNVPWQWS